MVKVILLLGLLVAVFIAESSSQLVVRPTFRPPRGGIVIIRPTYRPPRTRRPIIRYAREAGNEESQWLYKGDNIPRAPTSGDHPILPSIIDDVKIDPNRRYARSAGNEVPQWLFKGDDIPKVPASGDHPVVPSIIDDIKLDANRRHVRSVNSPSAKRGGGSHSTSSSSRNTGPTHPGHNRRNSRSVDSPSARRHGGHSTSSGTRDTGATHPGYNRRNTREIRLPTIYDPFRPSPTIPKPLDPFNPRPGLPRRPFPIYARATRDLHIPGVKKPTHRDVIIPNWNPNARVNPWQRIGVKSRNTRSVDISNNEEKRGFLEDLDTDFV